MRSTLLLLLALGIGSIVIAQPKADPPKEPDYSAELKRIPPLKADEALASFEVVPGFQLQLVASEPLIASPVAMAFDEDGRLFVVEMRDYSEHPNAKLGRVRLLEDDDGDGVMDRSTVFAEGLSWPTAIACSRGGVFVGAPPDILWLKDTDGDGRTDERKVIFTGFSRGNVQGMLNTFLHGLDHRIHCAASSNGGTVKRADDPQSKPLDLRGRDFAFDPITLEYGAISGGAQHGATFDDFGRRFVCSNSDHIQMIMYEDRYAARASGGPALAAPPSRMSIAADGPQAEVYRASKVEPWRELRTKLRVEGKVPGPIEGGGRAAGYFTSATGLTIYRGDAMPDLRGLAFIADVGSNIIHRKKLTPQGIGFVATRIDEKSEFLASSDNWFRPVQMANGPDGCLYIADMYREVIEHPASLPPAIKKHLDTDSGRDRGRIYRIAPDGYKPRAIPKLSKATMVELVKLLEHPNAWHRETASRLLHERQQADLAIQAKLQSMLADSKTSLGQLHALYTLDGLGSLRKVDVAGMLIRDSSSEVREHTLRLADRWMTDDAKLREIVASLAQGSDSVRVRFQAVMMLGAVDSPGKPAAAADLLVRDGDDNYIRWAALNATGGKRSPLIESLMSEGHTHAIYKRIQKLAAELDKDEYPAVARLMETQNVVNGAVVKGLAWSILRHGGDPDEELPKLSPRAADMKTSMTNTAEHTITDGQARLSLRLDAADWLAVAPPAIGGPSLGGVLSGKEPPELAQAAASAMARHPNAAMIPFLIDALPRSSTEARALLVDGLLSRNDRMIALLDALEAQKIPLTYLDGNQRMRLVGASQERIRQRASKLLAPAADRQGLVERYTRELFKLTGEPASGRKHFATHCAACHKLENVGHELGPNLAAFAQKGSDAILTNLLDPNREVNPQYLNHVVTLKDGEIVSGIIRSESASSVTVASGKGVERTVARSEIESMRATGKSIMPEGLESALDAQAAADLIAYLLSLKEAKP